MAKHPYIHLNNVGEVIAVLGGSEAVQQLTGLKAAAVSRWRGHDRIPSKFKDKMQAALAGRGYDAPSRLWAMVE
jgi:hypothetical protein